MGPFGLGGGFIESSIDDVVGASRGGRAGSTSGPSIYDNKEDLLGATDFDPVKLEATQGDGIAGSLGVEGDWDDFLRVSGGSGDSGLGGSGFGIGGAWGKFPVMVGKYLGSFLGR